MTFLQSLIGLLNKGETDMTKEYEIFTARLAYKLRECGFPILHTGINRNHPQFDTFFFEDTEPFREALVRLTKKQ